MTEENTTITTPSQSEGEGIASAKDTKAQTAQGDAARRVTKRDQVQALRELRERCEDECRQNADRSKKETEDKAAEGANTAAVAAPVSEQPAISPDADGDGVSSPHLPLQEGTSTDEGVVRELQQQLYNERARAAISSEIEKVRARFPEIKNTLDVVRLERYPAIKGMVARGYALSDAVRLAYEDVYVSSRTQAALREARGTPDTSHIRPTSPTTSASRDVSEEQIKVYLDSVPGATREGAIRAYQKYKIG